MKSSLRKNLPLLLCLILCLCLAPAALAEEADEIFILEDYKLSLPTDDFVTLGFELSDSEVFFAVGDIVTIRFDANGGTGTMASQDFVRGDAAKPLNPNTFTREGYFFLGWNERADGTAGGGRIIKNGADMRLSEASSSSMLTLYAQWEERTTEDDTVSVIFDANGGTGTMPAQVFVRGDVIKPLNPNTFTRDGYVFAGWNTKADDSGTAYQNDAKIAPVENMTLYAQWTDTVLVHYDPNGASGTKKMQKFTLGVPKKLSSIEAIGYVMEGYEFVGWAPVSDVGPDDPHIIPDGGEYTADSETRLYAIWKKVPAIAIDIDRTNFPDDSFRSYVSANLDQNGDGELSKSEIAAVTQINVSGSYNAPGTIQSLEGIQFFSRLQQLYCNYNRLMSLDLSGNTALRNLNCYGNQLTSLNLSNNTALTSLQCSRNQLTNLDVSHSNALSFLECGNNQLTSLNISQNEALKTLSCNDNQLLALDISACPRLVELIERTQPTISGSYVMFSGNAGRFSFDLNVVLTPALSFGPGIAIDENAFPDPAFRDYVKAFDLDENGELADVECKAVTGINVVGNPRQPGTITSFEGIQLFSALTSLQCAYNQLTSLDVSQNTALTSLYCVGNHLTSLDLSQNTALTELQIEGNQFTDIDLSSNPALTFLGCANNQLTALDLSKNASLKTLYCGRNPLTGLDLSHNPALTSLSCDNNQLTALDLSHNPMLMILYCSGNQLTDLDLSANTALTRLSCHSNLLSALDVSQCPVLAELVESTMPSIQNYSTKAIVIFSSPDTNNASLQFDHGVKLTPAIDFGPGVVVDETMFPDPVFLDYVRDFDIDCNGVLSDAEFKQVATINVTGKGITSLQGIELFPNLKGLFCSNNQLTSLDLSHNPALRSLLCDGNQLAALDLSAAPILSLVYEAFEPQYFENAANYHVIDYGSRNSPAVDGDLLRYDRDVSVITGSSLALPSELSEIGEEAFADCAFRYVIAPDDLTTIGSRAFADCRDLVAVYIPENMTEIAPDAFDGVSGLSVFGIHGSTAHLMAQRYGFQFYEYYLY